MTNINKLLSLATSFLKQASDAEKIPPKTDNLNTILSNLQNLETFQARMKYAEKNLKHLSSGSSRIVFQVGKDKVLKLASNEKGLAQNKAESSVKDDCKYINKSVRNAKNHSWIIAPMADKITEREFFDLTGVNFREFGDCIIYNSSTKKDKKEPKNFQSLKNEEIVKQISSVIDKK